MSAAWATGAAARQRARPLDSELAWRLDVFNKFLLAASPVERVTASVGREVCRALGFSRAAFLIANFGARRARGAAGYGVDVAALGRVSEPFESSPWILESMTSGEPRYTLNPGRGALLPLRYVEMFGLGPLLCVPVRDNADPLAVMLLDRCGEPFAISDELLRAAACAAASLGLALQAARGYGGARHGERRGARAEVPVLTVRQRQVLGMLARGLSNKEISTATGLSVLTVRDHVSSVLHCLDVPSRSAAIARAWELGLLGR